MTGSGALADPYVIWDVNDLQNIALDLAAYYELGQDIDGSGFAFTPLGSLVAPFTGTLDGREYAVTGLSITVTGLGTRNAALFVWNQGTIENLEIENCAISATSTNGGQCRAAAVCYENDGGNITAVHVTGTITATIPVLCAAWVQAAGLVAWNWNGGTIRRCSSAAVVTGISGGNALVGGLVAENDATILESYASGDVAGTITVGNGDLYVGGFSGVNGFAADGTISDSYARGDATASGGNPSYAGGFTAANMTAGSTLTRAYSTGIPTADTIAGGLCALNTGTITDCFWDIETSGQAISDGGTGKTTAQMKNIATFSSVGWDIELTTEADPTYGYPFLSWQLGSSPIWLIFGETPRPLGYSLVQQELLELLRR